MDEVETCPTERWRESEATMKPTKSRVAMRLIRSPLTQVHNLVRPSPEILRNVRRMEMLKRLRQLLRTAENSVRWAR